MTKLCATLTMGNDPRHVHLAGALARAFCEVIGMPTLEGARLELAVVEAVNNVVEHACRHLPAAKINLNIGVEMETLVIELRDPGSFRLQSPSVVMPEPLAESGRGWPLILAGVDHVDYRIEDGLNVLVLSKKAAPNGPNERRPFGQFSNSTVRPAEGGDGEPGAA